MKPAKANKQLLLRRTSTMKVQDEQQPISADLIRHLARILKESDLTDLEIDKGDLHIRLTRNNGTIAIPHDLAPHASNALQSPANALNSINIQETELNMDKAVTSPMVGTAYLAASPGAEKFIHLEQMVTKGQTLLIIEAMKTMNQIIAPHDGIVKAILVKDAQPVEFDEPLVIIE